jgi:ribonuclease VapC
VSETKYILDASALLALMLGERGADKVHEVLPGAYVSTVNVAEVVSKLQDYGVPEDVIRRSLTELDLDVVQFDMDQAHHAGVLRAVTKSKGLSLGDRACLAAAHQVGAVAVTADREWLAIADQAAVVILAVR